MDTVKEQINATQLYDLLDDYIKNNWNSISTIEDALMGFQVLNDLLKGYNCLPETTLLNELLDNNAYFRDIIDMIAHEYDLQQVLDNNLLTAALQIYLMSGRDSQNNDAYLTTDNVGMYLNDLYDKSLLSIQEEKELSKKVIAGDSRAREKFIESNLRLVISIAKKYKGSSLPLADLIQEGNLGLIMAVDTYDGDQGYRFSTYATLCIRRAINRAIDSKSKTIRIPESRQKNIKLYRKAAIKLQNELQRSPTIVEIANEAKIPLKEMLDIYNFEVDTVSLNQAVGEEDDAELGCFVASGDKTPEEELMDEDFNTRIRQLLKKCDLKPRERDILMLKYGLNDGEPMTSAAIGLKYDLSRERIRQIVEQALIKIRKSKYVKEFVIYATNPGKSLRDIEKFQESSKNNCKEHKAYFKDTELMDEDLPKILNKKR